MAWVSFPPLTLKPLKVSHSLGLPSGRSQATARRRKVNKLLCTASKGCGLSPDLVARLVLRYKKFVHATATDKRRFAQDATCFSTPTTK